MDMGVVPTGQTAQQTAVIFQLRLLDQVVSMTVVAVLTVQPVEIPQLHFLDTGGGWWIQTVQSCCSWTRLSCPLMQDLISGLDVQKTVDVPQLQFLTPMVALPVEIPQGAVLG